MFGEVVREHRRRLGLTQEQLADRTGISARGLGKIEAGSSGSPRVRTVHLLADALGLAGSDRERFCATAASSPSTPSDPDTAVAPAPSNAPAQLPSDVVGFTGRASQLDRLDGLLTQGQAPPTAVAVAAISGSAGVGKTALALHWAHRVRTRFPDGQLFVNLRGRSPAGPLRPLQVLAQFLQAVGVPAEQVPIDLDGASALYRTALDGKRLLIVLDDAADAAQVRPLLPGSPGSLVLVTSRDRLGGLVARQGAHQITVDTLEPAEAEELLAGMLGRERVQSQATAAAELARRCALLPLALRIAAANLLAQPDRPLADYLLDLDEGNRLAALTVDGDEQADVRAAFTLSYQALLPQARQLFRLLGLVPGPDVTEPAAAALVAAPIERTRELLQRLTGAHLLARQDPARFGSHDLLRLYATEQAERTDTEADRLAATGRLLAWYLQTADTAARLLYPEMLRLPLPPADASLPEPPFDDSAQALAWLDAERANLIAAVQHAAARGPRPLAWGLADALRGYFRQRMDAVDWLTVAEAGQAAARDDGDARAVAATEFSFAEIHRRQGRPRQAIEHQRSALDLSRQSGWVHGQACALDGLGTAYWQLGALDRAADHYTRALALYRSVGWNAGEAVCLGNIGLVLQRIGRLEEAAEHHTQALALDRELGSRWGEGVDLANLGDVEHALGRLDDAFEHLTEALLLHREVGDRGAEAETLRLLAAVHRDAGRYPQALDHGTAALERAREIGDQRVQAEALSTLAGMQHHLGDHRRAIEQYNRAVELAQASEASFSTVKALLGLAAAHGDAGHPEQAAACARRAQSLAREGGYRLLEDQALAMLASCDLDGADVGRAAGG